MKFDVIALAVAAVAFVAALAGCNWLLGGYAPGLSLAAVFIDSDPVAKLVMLSLMLLAFPVLLLGVIGILVRGAARAVVPILRVAALTATVLGLLTTAYGWMNIQGAVRRVGPVSLEVVASSYVEILLVLAYALLVAAFALLFAVGAGLRAGRLRKADAAAGNLGKAP